MTDESAIVAGELAPWPTKLQLVAVLREAGLTVDVGRYAVRVEDCQNFEFAEYGGDLGEPEIVAGADSVDAMRHDAGLVSQVLSRAAIRHRFEVDDAASELRGYLHFDRPKPGTGGADAAELRS